MQEIGRTSSAERHAGRDGDDFPRLRIAFPQRRGACFLHHFGHVLYPVGKAQPSPPQLQAEFQIFAVLRRQCRKRQDNAGNVDAFAFR